MVTYPSTHGVFEDDIAEICAARARRRRPGLRRRRQPQRAGRAGQARASSAPTSRHLNLHKTFCIPHGGGGPGVGPVGVRAHLAPFLPNHPLRPRPGRRPASARSPAAPWGSAGILPISWAYVRLMGADGLHARPPSVAILAANYVAARLRAALPGALHRPRRPGRARVHPRPAADHQGDRRHRRRRRQAADRLRLPRADDVVPGRRHADGRADRDRGPGRARPVLRRDDRDPRRDRRRSRPGSGPRTTTRCATPRTPPAMLAGRVGPPLPARRRRSTRCRRCGATKYWPPVRRIDGAYGDRNLVCSCPPPEAFATDLSGADSASTAVPNARAAHPLAPVGAALG